MVITPPENKAFLHFFRADSRRTTSRSGMPDRPDARVNDHQSGPTALEAPNHLL
jgi:hypothetical protein